MSIPKAVREHLKLKPGQRLKYFIRQDVTVLLLQPQQLTALRATLRREGTLLTRPQSRSRSASAPRLPAPLSRSVSVILRHLIEGGGGVLGGDAAEVARLPFVVAPAAV